MSAPYAQPFAQDLKPEEEDKVIALEHAVAAQVQVSTSVAVELAMVHVVHRHSHGGVGAGGRNMCAWTTIMPVSSPVLRMDAQHLHCPLMYTAEATRLIVNRLDQTSSQANPIHVAYCTRGTYVRYLRARGWHVDRAAKMLLATLAWREHFRPDLLNWTTVKSSLGRGKLMILGQSDHDGRPVVLMRPRCSGGSGSDPGGGGGRDQGEGL